MLLYSAYTYVSWLVRVYFVNLVYVVRIECFVQMSHRPYVYLFCLNSY